MTASAAIPAAKPQPQPWLFNPAIDLMFCCGGLFWLLFFLHIGLSPNPIESGSGSRLLPYEVLLLPLGAAVFANSHIVATLLRLYGNKETRNRLWFHSYVVLFLTIGLIFAAAYNEILLVLLIRLYASLTFDHTISQNYGITLMYSFRSGYRWEPKEKMCLKVMYHSLTWFAILRQFSIIDFCPSQQFGFRIPLLGPLPMPILYATEAVLVGSTLATLAIIVRKFVKDKQLIPFPALFLIITSLIMFTAGLNLSLIFFLFTPAFFHAAQYLVVTTAYNLREKGLTENADCLKMTKLLLSFENIKYVLFLYIFGAALYGGLPTLMTLGGISFTQGWAAVFIGMGFHHFIADSALWKLRDAKVRKNLVG